MVRNMALAALSLLMTCALATSDKLHFVYELTRHGARAPTSISTGYKVGPGMLTANGMRQRYLLGAHNRKRYGDEYGLIDVEANDFSEIMIQSTLVNRTIQSGYSELLGLYQPNKATA